MSRPPSPHLSYDKTKQKHYKWIDNKKKLFGPKGPTLQTYDAAWAEYQVYLREQDQPFEGLTFTPDGLIVSVDPKPHVTEADLQRMLDDKHYFYTKVVERIKTTDGQPETERNRQLVAVLYWVLGHLRNIKEMEEFKNSQSSPKRKKDGAILSDVYDFWEKTRNPTSKHQRKTKERFNHFVELVGDVQFDELTEDHIRLYIQSMRQEGRSGNDIAAHMSHTRLVLNFTNKPLAMQSTEYPTKIQPHKPADLANLTRMLNLTAEEKTDPDPHNQRPFPPDEYQKITATIRKDKDRQFLCVWLLACQTGANMTDFERLVWGESLILDHKTPHLHLARIKRGRGERVIPLRKETVQALKKYRASLKPANQADGQFAFLHLGDRNRNKPISTDHISNMTETYRDAAGVNDKWTYKHLRNVGPNVAKDKDMKTADSWAFLGQTAKLGELQKYEYQNPRQLLPYVNAIATEYFSGKRK